MTGMLNERLWSNLTKFHIGLIGVFGDRCRIKRLVRIWVGVRGAVSLLMIFVIL